MAANHVPADRKRRALEWQHWPKADVYGGIDDRL